MYQKDSGIYIHYRISNYIEKNGNEYNTYSSAKYIDDLKLGIYKQHQKTLQSRRLAEVGGNEGMLEIYDEFLRLFSIPDELQNLVDGELGMFSFTDGKNNEKLGETKYLDLGNPRGTRARAKRNIQRSVDNFANFLTQVEEKMYEVAKTLADPKNTSSVRETLALKKIDRPGYQVPKTLVRFMNDVVEDKGFLSVEGNIAERADDLVSKITAIINTIKGYNEVEFKIAIRNNTSLVYEFARKIVSAIRKLLGDIGEEVSYYALASMQEEFIKRLKELGYEVESLGVGSVGDVFYTSSGGLILSKEAKFIMDDKLKQYVEGLDISNDEVFKQSKGDVITAFRISNGSGSFVINFPLSVKNYTRDIYSMGTTVNLQKFEGKDDTFYHKLISTALWQKIGFQHYLYNIYGSSYSKSKLDKYYISADERRANIQNIVDYVGANCLLDAIMGKSGQKTQNIIALVVGQRIYRIEDILDDLISQILADDYIGPSVIYKVDTKAQTTKPGGFVKAKKGDGEDAVNKAAQTRSSNTIQKINNALAAAKLSVKMKVTSLK